jgi:isoquinoline 1-oxidoreductase beta subunit
LGGVLSAGALVLGAAVLPRHAMAGENGDATWQPSVYLGLEPDGRVIIVAHRSEMGTGIRTSLPMVVADELEADWKRVKIVQATCDAKYGNQDTDGSESIRDFYEPMRQAGATARVMLESAAASKWGVPASECQAKNHEIVHTKSGRKLGFGELVPLAARQPVPKKESLKFKSPAEYRYVGQNVPIADLDGILDGHAVFGMDARMPGMVYASIERPPVFGGTLKTYDDAEARKIRGVSKTLTIPPFKAPYGFQALGGVAVISTPPRTRRRCKRPRGKAAKSRATMATWMLLSRRLRRSTKPNTMCRTLRTHRWSPRSRWRSSRMARLWRGRRLRIRRPCRTQSPRRLASARKT